MDDAANLQDGTLRVENGAIYGSYADSDWTLDEGDGDRSTTRHVEFGTRFDSTPHITVALCNCDTYSAYNARIDVQVVKPTGNGFELQFRTWGNTLCYGAGASWLAIGS